MGFFSWKTQDTDKSIANMHSNREPFFVCMHDNKGNIWTEKYYEGYGEFGGKDFYELLAEMNGLKTRQQGIDLAYSGKEYLSPNLTEAIDWTWTNEKPESCKYQGYFYNDDEVDELDEDDDSWLVDEDEDDYDYDDPSTDHLRDEERNFIEDERNRERDN